MAMKPDHNLMTYAVKKNHMQIYTEFLNFQTLGSSRLDEPIITLPSIHSKNEKKLNLRNFRALYWIILYLKNIKGNSLGLIHEFFLHKQWTTWQFKNFSYHYHRLMKLEHIHQEIQYIAHLVQLEEGFSHMPITTPTEKPPAHSQSPSRETDNKPYQPLKLGEHLPTNDTVIRPNCTLEESFEKLRLAKESALSHKINS